MDYETPFRIMPHADAANRDVVDMVSGNPDWEPPEALREGVRTYADGNPADFQYSASEGLPPIREEISARRGVEVARVLVEHASADSIARNDLPIHADATLAWKAVPFETWRTVPQDSTPM